VALATGPSLFLYATKNSIHLHTLNSSKLLYTVSQGSNGIKGLTYDWASRQIYFSNAYPHETYLEIMRHDGLYRKILSTKNNPSSLAVNPIKKRLFAVDSGQYPRIGSYKLDGTDFVPIVTSGVVRPITLTIDFNTHEVFWADAGLDTIQKVNADGSNRVVVVRSTPSPVGVAVGANSFFYADSNLNSIFNKNSTGGNAKRSLLKSNMKDLVAVGYYSPENSPRVQDNQCSTLNLCAQLCFADSSGSHCDCADGKMVGYKCQAFDEFLVFATRTEIRSVLIGGDSNNLPWNPVVS